jgi:hypothetical protein
MQCLHFCKPLNGDDNVENRGYKGWGIKKLDNRPVKVLMGDCEDPKLAAKCYNMFVGGYSEEEVAIYFEVPVNIVERAIQHTRSCLSGRTIIAHNNDRLRILVQRNESEKYRKLLGDALSINAEDFLKAGIAPAGTLKEFRECVGLTEKPGGIGISLTQNTMIARKNEWNGFQIRSPEDLIRAIVKADPSCALGAPVDNGVQQIIESAAEAQQEADGEDFEADLWPNDPVDPE